MGKSNIDLLRYTFTTPEIPFFHWCSSPPWNLATRFAIPSLLSPMLSLPITPLSLAPRVPYFVWLVRLFAFSCWCHSTIVCCCTLSTTSSCHLCHIFAAVIHSASCLDSENRWGVSSTGNVNVIGWFFFLALLCLLPGFQHRFWRWRCLSGHDTPITGGWKKRTTEST